MKLFHKINTLGEPSLFNRSDGDAKRKSIRDSEIKKTKKSVRRIDTIAAICAVVSSMITYYEVNRRKSCLMFVFKNLGGSDHLRPKSTEFW